MAREEKQSKHPMRSFLHARIFGKFSRPAYSIKDNWISLRDIVQLSGRHTTSISKQYIVFLPMAKYNASPRMNTRILARQFSKKFGKETRKDSQIYGNLSA